MTKLEREYNSPSPVHFDYDPNKHLLGVLAPDIKRGRLCNVEFGGASAPLYVLLTHINTVLKYHTDPFTLSLKDDDNPSIQRAIMKFSLDTEDKKDILISFLEKDVIPFCNAKLIACLVCENYELDPFIYELQCKLGSGVTAIGKYTITELLDAIETYKKERKKENDLARIPYSPWEFFGFSYNTNNKLKWTIPQFETEVQKLMERDVLSEEQVGLIPKLRNGLIQKNIRELKSSVCSQKIYTSRDIYSALKNLVKDKYIESCDIPDLYSYLYDISQTKELYQHINQMRFVDIRLLLSDLLSSAHADNNAVLKNSIAFASKYPNVLSRIKNDIRDRFMMAFTKKIKRTDYGYTNTIGNLAENIIKHFSKDDLVTLVQLMLIESLMPGPSIIVPPSKYPQHLGSRRPKFVLKNRLNASQYIYVGSYGDDGMELSIETTIQKPYQDEYNKKRFQIGLNTRIGSPIFICKPEKVTSVISERKPFRSKITKVITLINGDSLKFAQWILESVRKSRDFTVEDNVPTLDSGEYQFDIFSHCDVIVRVYNAVGRGCTPIQLQTGEHLKIFSV